MVDSPSLKTQDKKPENSLFSLIFNILIPSLILIKLKIDPKLTLLIALAFPISYSIWFFITRRSANLISILGFINVLLTGGLGILAVSKIWFAIKEATLPLVIGIAVLTTVKSQNPLINSLFFNKNLVDTERIKSIIETNNSKDQFDHLTYKVSLIIACAFFLSSILNFILAIVILKHTPGTEAFNKDLGTMNLLSYPIICGSCSILMFVAVYVYCKDIKRLTGLKMEEILKTKS